jgi:hypothetical protein
VECSEIRALWRFGAKSRQAAWLVRNEVVKNLLLTMIPVCTLPETL